MAAPLSPLLATEEGVTHCPVSHLAYASLQNTCYCPGPRRPDALLITLQVFLIEVPQQLCAVHGPCIAPAYLLWSQSYSTAS